jgi:hypothetical protein
MMGAIQWTLGYVVQAKMNRPAVTKGPPRIAEIGQFRCEPYERATCRLTWRQPPLGLKFICPVRLVLIIPFQSLIIATPDRIRKNRKDHTDKKTHKAKAPLPQIKAIDFSEDQLERAEEKVQDTQ